MTLRTLNYGNYGIFLINYGIYGTFLINYGNYGIFLIMGNAGFCPSTLVSRHPSILSPQKALYLEDHGT